MTPAEPTILLPRKRRKRPTAMSEAELATLGQTLWGTGWRGKMSRELGVGRSTVSKWEHGTHPIPVMAARLLRMLAESGD